MRSLCGWRHAQRLSLARVQRHVLFLLLVFLVPKRGIISEIQRKKLHFLLESTFLVHFCSIRADFCGFCGSIGKCMPLRGPVALDVPSESGSGEGSDSLLQAVPASGVDPSDRGSLGSAWEPAPSLPHAPVIGLISAIFLRVPFPKHLETQQSKTRISGLAPFR